MLALSTCVLSALTEAYFSASGGATLPPLEGFLFDRDEASCLRTRSPGLLNASINDLWLLLCDMMDLFFLIF